MYLYIFIYTMAAGCFMIALTRYNYKVSKYNRHDNVTFKEIINII